MEDDVIVIVPKKAPKSAKIYKCPKCSYQTNRAYNVQRHMVNHYEKPPMELQHICPYAGCSFTTLRWDNLIRHRQGIHRESTNATTKIKNKKEIKMSFQEDSTLSDDGNLSTAPSIEYPANKEEEEEEFAFEEDDQASLPYDENDESMEEYPEPISEAQSKHETKINKQNIVKPKRTHQKGKTKTYECNSCSYRTTRCYNIKRHIVKHMENPGAGVELHVCIIAGCKFVTPRWDNLCRHVKRIHPETVNKEPNGR
ncbi:zinc finger and BTB domain-containing protein 41 [Drosophila mojavensis]|uniref:C2H2-type domain-containing protein n=1 Tax=Drosophila mojavensis TaxID=7230 RepID=B4KES7_DROMO|nr:zinc finger and BTB domain-containing protein 41 [Drosophila mojavensis]EDW12977.2 uncharacterized protein Dmoj_GI22051 [Drosophila mojavensis]